jgi:hypothetical protein
LSNTSHQILQSFVSIDNKSCHKLADFFFRHLVISSLVEEEEEEFLLNTHDFIRAMNCEEDNIFPQMQEEEQDPIVDIEPYIEARLEEFNQDGSDGRTDYTYLVFQTAIIDKFFVNGVAAPFRTGSIACSDESRARATWEDYVDIHRYKTTKLLSLRDGNHLLALIR